MPAKCLQDIKFDIIDKIGKDLTEQGLFQYGPVRNILLSNSDEKSINRILSIYNDRYGEELLTLNKIEDKLAVLISPSEDLAEKYLNNYRESNKLQEKERFALDQLERSYNIDYTGPNTQRLIYLSPAREEAGVYEKFVSHKEQLATILKEKLNRVATQLKNSKLTVEERTKLNNLRQGLKNRLEGDIHRGTKGLLQEIEELRKVEEASVDAVGYYVVQDLNRLANISKSNDVRDIEEAQHIISFYDRAGTFQTNEDNPFFTSQEMFFTDDNGALTGDYKLADSVMSQFKDWREKALSYQSTIDLRRKDATVNTFNANKGIERIYQGKKFNFDEIVHTKSGLRDLDWVSAWAMDITQGLGNTSKLSQVMQTYLLDTLERNYNWSRDFAHRMEAMTPEVTKRLKEIDNGKYQLKAFGILGVNGVSYDLFLDKTSSGMDTGTLVQRFTTGFMEEQRKAGNKFKTSFDSARTSLNDAAKPQLFNAAFTELKAWKRANTIIMNPSLIEEITDDPEYGQFNTKATKEAKDAHKTELIRLLGTKGYNQQVERQKSLLNKYIAEKQSYIDSQMIFEGVDDANNLSEAAKYAIKQWDNQHNPMVGVEDFYSAEGVYMDSRKINSYMDYNNTIPRSVKVKASVVDGKYNFQDTNEPTNYYNKEFQKIESDPTLDKFYDLLSEGLDKIREITPADIQAKMVANSLPMLMKNSMEILLHEDNGKLSILSSAWRRLWERIRLSFGLVQQSEISYAVKDPITGRYNYKVNDQFLQGNSRNIKELETIEKLKFSAASGMSNIKRFSTIPFNRLNEESLAQLAVMLNIDISMDEIEQGNVQKIKALVGDSVEIGKIIRDYATHTAVQAQSFDLPKLMKYFTNAAMAYAGRTEALPVMKIMKDHYDGIKDVKTNNIGRAIFHVPEDTVASEGPRDQAVKQMEDWFQRVMLNNHGIKHFGEHGSVIKEIKGQDGNLQTKFPWHRYGRKIYSAEDKKKIKEIDRLLSIERDEEKIQELRDIKDRLGKVRTLSALMVNFLATVRTLGLGWNVGSSITNLMEGYTSNMILAASGEYFDPAEIYYAIGVARQGWSKNISFGLRTTPDARLCRTLMDRYNILIDSKNELQRSTVKTTLSHFEKLNPHELSARVEYFNQSPIMIAMLRTIKIEDSNGEKSSVWDAMDKKTGKLIEQFRSDKNVNNWEKLAGEEYAEFKNKVNEAITKGHGNYDEMRGMMIKSSLAGKAVMMFKTWLPAQLYWRFAAEQDNLKTGAKIKGRFRSFTPGTGAVYGLGLGAIAFGAGPLALAAGGAGLIAGRFFGIQTELGALKEMAYTTQALFKKALGMPVNVLAGKNLINSTGDFEKWVGSGRFSEVDAKNMRGNMAELALAMTTLAFMLLVKSFFWDDDDNKEDTERQFHNFAVNRLMQLSAQATMYVSPGDLWKSTFGSIGAMTFLDNLNKELDKMQAFISGNDPGGVKVLQQSTKFLPGVFKNPLNLGLSNSATRQFKPSPFDKWFWSEAHTQAVEDKQTRANRNQDLKNAGYTEDERVRILNIEYPTTKQLHKKGLSREEWEAQQEDYVRPEPGVIQQQLNEKRAAKQ